MVDATYLETHLGPVDFVVVDLPDDVRAADGFQRLLDLVDEQVIRVLDLEFITRREQGGLEVISASQAGEVLGFDVSAFEGASSGLLTDADFDDVSENLRAGGVAAVLVYEELALFPVLASWEQAGATLLGEGTIDPAELVEALDATE